MNFRKVMIVFRKELMEVLRDKRTLFTTLLLPVILYPVLIIGFNAIMTRQTGVLEERGATVAIIDSVNTQISSRLIAGLEEIPNFSFIPAGDDVQGLYDAKEIQSVVTLKDSLAGDGLIKYHIYIQYDAANERSNMTYGKIFDVLEDIETELISDQLQISGISPELMNMVDVRGRDTADSQKKMGMILGMFLPYIMIIMLFTGASVVAADLVAGEKERKTLETLLVASVGRLEIVIGKFLTIITLSMLNLIVNLFSISFSLRFMLSQSGLDMAGAGMPIKAILILLAAMLPLATLFAAILLSISTFSRNMKEARTYESPLMMVSMIMAMISFLPAIEMNSLMAMIPIVNISLLFKAVMVNEYQVSHLMITILSTVVLVIIAIWGSIKLFNNEGVLMRSDDDSSSLKGIKKNRANFFTPYNGMVYFTLALLLLYYVASRWQMQDLARGLVMTQVIVIALPVFILLKVLKMKAAPVLRITMPRLKELILIPFIAIPATVIVAILAQFINSIYPFPEHYLESLGKLFEMNLPLWGSFLVVAVAPGFCEELLFRGLFPRFFQKYGMKVNIVITALLFAAFHLDPFRFVPVFLLGALLGYLTLRSGSIIHSMIAHTINNGLALLISVFSGSQIIKLVMMDSENLHYWVVIPAAIILFLALRAFHRFTERGEEICVES